MPDIEKPQLKNKKESPTSDKDLQRECYFRAFVLSHLLHTIQDSLEEAGFSSSDISAFGTELAKLHEEDQLLVLAIPFEIREKFFSNYNKKITEGEISPTDVVKDILEKNRQYGFTLGYHLSNHRILKERDGNGEKWNVKGSELDDRDNMLMAYYSEDYAHRYKNKNGDFLYAIRAETGPNSSHKRDLNNRWGRAPLLPIIDEFDMKEIEEKTNEATQKESAAT
jgi:hypothetical protein